MISDSGLVSLSFFFFIIFSCFDVTLIILKTNGLNKENMCHIKVLNPKIHVKSFSFSLLFTVCCTELYCINVFYYNVIDSSNFYLQRR